MALWRFLLVFALAFGSVLPHCAAAAPAAPRVLHHAAMVHDQQEPAHHAPATHQSDACIGCATAVRLALTPLALTMIADTAYCVVQSMPTTRVTALDPPPPRRTA